MVIYDSENLKRLSRDELVEKGLRAAARAERSFRRGKRGRPWIYNSKVKSGVENTENSQYQAWNLPHLKAQIIIEHAKESEVLSAYAIKRVMKAQMKSVKEDY